MSEIKNGPERPKNALIGSLQNVLLGTLPMVGFLSAALIYVSIFAGLLAIMCPLKKKSYNFRSPDASSLKGISYSATRDSTAVSRRR